MGDTYGMTTTYHLIETRLMLALLALITAGVAVKDDAGDFIVGTGPDAVDVFTTPVVGATGVAVSEFEFARTATKDIDTIDALLAHFGVTA